MLGLCWYKWGKWEIFNKTSVILNKHGTFVSDKNGDVINSTETWQRRICSKCGKIQDAEVKVDSYI